jgi:hypothetical protein
MKRYKGQYESITPYKQYKPLMKAVLEAARQAKNIHTTNMRAHTRLMNWHKPASQKAKNHVMAVESAVKTTKHKRCTCGRSVFHDKYV